MASKIRFRTLRIFSIIVADWKQNPPFIKDYISKTKNLKIDFSLVQNIAQQFGAKNRDGSFWRGVGGGGVCVPLTRKKILYMFSLMIKVELSKHLIKKIFWHFFFSIGSFIHYKTRHNVAYSSYVIRVKKISTLTAEEAEICAEVRFEGDCSTYKKPDLT